MLYRDMKKNIDEDIDAFVDVDTLRFGYFSPYGWVEGGFNNSKNLQILNYEKYTILFGQMKKTKEWQYVITDVKRGVGDFIGIHWGYNKNEVFERLIKDMENLGISIKESKKSDRKSLKESSDSILDKEFYNLVEEGYIYDEDENGMNMSYGEYASVSDDLWEVLADELKRYRDFPSAYDAYEEIMNNTSDDAKMFMGVSDDDYFYFSIDEDEGTYTFGGEVPSVLEKLFKEFQKETDLERA